MVFTGPVDPAYQGCKQAIVKSTVQLVQSQQLSQAVAVKGH